MPKKKITSTAMTPKTPRQQTTAKRAPGSGSGSRLDNSGVSTRARAVTATAQEPVPRTRAEHEPESAPAPAIRHVPGRRGPKRDDERAAAQAAFLSHFAVAGNITAACRAAVIARSTLYEWLEHDEAFGLRYNVAKQEAIDILKAAAFERAVKGVERYVVSAGRIVRDERTGRPLVEREYSDTLLLNLLRAHAPEFKQSARVELSGPDGGPIEVRNDARARLLEQLERLGAARGAVGPDAAEASEGDRPTARRDRRASSR